MSELSEFLENKEQIKIAIMDYEDFDIEIIHYKEEYYRKHWREFLTDKEKGKVEPHSDPLFDYSEFYVRLFSYLWTKKVSELLTILYIMDLNSQQPTIWGLNNLLKRNSSQCSATNKAVNKLQRLEIVKTEEIKGSPRGERKVYINKDIATIYGDDEFRQMMLDEWDGEAERYIEEKLKGLLEEKKKVEERIKRIKKGR